MKRRLLRIVGGLLILPFLLSTHCDDEYDDFPSNGIQVDENIYRLENVSFGENGVLVGIGEQNVRFELWLSLADGTAVSNRFMLAQARDAAFNIEASSGAISLRTSLTGDDALYRAVKGTIEAARSDYKVHFHLSDLELVSPDKADTLRVPRGQLVFPLYVFGK